MKWSGAVVLISFVVLPALPAAYATSPIDYTQRNGTFAPSATIRPETKPTQRADAVQDKRVEKTMVDKSQAAVGDRRAPIDVTSTHDKTVLEKDSRRPEASERVTSDFNHRSAAITTKSDTQKPPMVAKYQDSMTATSAATTARFAALSGASRAKINRFIFRKNGAAGPGDGQETTGRALNDAPVIPAAGGAAVRK